MNNYEELVTKYQHLFSEDCYIECDIGWYQIISNLLHLIDNEQKFQKQYSKGTGCEPVQIVQIKEKFGGLRCYIDGGNAYISGINDFAEYMSYVTCEHCGNPGKERSTGWIKTLCDKCHNSPK